MMTRPLQTLTLSLAVAVATAASSSYSNSNSNAFIQGHLKDLPETGQDWMTLQDGSEFLPADDLDLGALNLDFEIQVEGTGSNQERSLLFSSSKRQKYNSPYAREFIDGSGHYYNDYAQAWRLLGFYIDCNAPHNNVNECYDDGDDDRDQAACQRYLLWAAYIDEDYAGGGIGEYQFYDRKNQQWDTSSCKAGNGRCAKMDCHLKDTNFKLLGFFKEPNYHEWMEQLFKHQGVCLWTDEEYNFMDTDRYLWPCYCTSTGQTDEDGNTLYYDTKPMPEGRIGLGLYTDNRCKFDYIPGGNSADILEVLENGGGDKNEYGSVTQLKKGLEQWNDAFDVFKVCQPCKAYNLGYNQDVNKGGRQGGDADEGYTFDCYDDADYVNVNQCMKFKTKTEMLAADFRDIMMAHEQGNIVEFEVMGKTYGYGGYRTSQGTLIRENFNLTAKPGIPTSIIVFFTLSLAFLCTALASLGYLYYKQRRRGSAKINLNDAPLMNNASGTLA